MLSNYEATCYYQHMGLKRCPASQAVKTQRLHLLAAAEEDLGKVKRQFFLQLAKDRGVLAEYRAEIKARCCLSWAGHAVFERSEPIMYFVCLWDTHV